MSAVGVNVGHSMHALWGAPTKLVVGAGATRSSRLHAGSLIRAPSGVVG